MTKSKVGIDPRKLPSQSRATATYSCILEAAARILERQGMDGYNTNAVAALAGVSIGSLYQYFPNKNALTAALFKRESQHFMDEVSAAAADQSFGRAISRILRATVMCRMRRPQMARILLDEAETLKLGVRDESARTWLRDVLILVLEKPGCPQLNDVGRVALDLMWMVKAISDAALARGESDCTALQLRLEHAVFGFVSMQARSHQTSLENFETVAPEQLEEQN